MSALFAGSGNQPAYDADYTNLHNELIYKINGPAAPGAKESAAMNWKHADEADNQILNSILWRDRKGDIPVPEPRHTVFPETPPGR
jgi:hypothetical protein